MEITIFTTNLFLLVAKHVSMGIWNVPLHSRSYDALKKKKKKKKIKFPINIIYILCFERIVSIGQKKSIKIVKKDICVVHTSTKEK